MRVTELQWILIAVAVAVPIVWLRVRIDQRNTRYWRERTPPDPEEDSAVAPETHVSD